MNPAQSTVVPFHYGRGVFETLVVQNGKVRYQDWHEASLREAAGALGLEVKGIEIPQVPAGDGIWRWMLSPDGFVTTWQPGLPSPPEVVDLELSPLRVSSNSWEARYKTFSYLLMWQARAQASGGWAVLLNEHARLASATMANIFWMNEGQWHTPAPYCGCRCGIVRRWVIERSGVVVREVEAGLAELDQAEEIFLTNSRLGVFPVRSWRGRQLASTAGGRLRILWTMDAGDSGGAGV